MLNHFKYYPPVKQCPIPLCNFVESQSIVSTALQTFRCLCKFHSLYSGTYKSSILAYAICACCISTMCVVLSRSERGWLMLIPQISCIITMTNSQTCTPTSSLVTPMKKGTSRKNQSL